jgi:hypothetical protein
MSPTPVPIAAPTAAALTLNRVAERTKGPGCAIDGPEFDGMDFECHVSSRPRESRMDDRDDDMVPEFVSPPFSTIFLTTAKVIISALLIFAALGVIGTFVAVFVGWLSLR